MEEQQTKPAGDRRNVRLVLLLILLATVLVWAKVLHKRSQAPGPFTPEPLARRETVVNGVPLLEIFNVPYAFDPAVRVDQLQMDLLLPQDAKRVPILLYLHGGGWLGGNKNGIGPKGEAFASQGFAIASVNYRLGPVTPLPNAASDIAAAVAMLRRLAPPLGADPDCIILMGHSAGAHLAALMMADERYLSPYPGAATAIKGMILLDGSAYHLPKMMQSKRGALFTDAFGDNPTVWEQVSPYHFAVKRQGLPRTLLAYAGDDAVRAESASELAEVLRRGGTEAEVRSVPDKTHETIDDNLKNLDEPFTQYLLEFVRKCAR